MLTLWNASVAVGPYALSLLCVALAIWGLDWVFEQWANIGAEEAAAERLASIQPWGDVVSLPEDAKTAAKSRGAGERHREPRRPSNSHTHNRSVSDSGQGSI